jgi:hypothetical protein
MAVKDAHPAMREAVGIFFDTRHLHEAIDDLESAGFDFADLGLLAGQYTVRQKLGKFYAEINESADRPEGPRVAFVADSSMGDTVHAWFGSLFFIGTTVASGAMVASAAVLGGALLAAVSGAAALVGVTGGALALIIHESDAEYLEEQVDEGHLLLFVRTNDPEREKIALEILTKHGAFDARMYEVPAPKGYAA